MVVTNMDNRELVKGAKVLCEFMRRGQVNIPTEIQRAWAYLENGLAGGEVRVEKCALCEEVKEIAFDDFGLVACYACEEKAYRMTERKYNERYLLEG